MKITILIITIIFSTVFCDETFKAINFKNCKSKFEVLKVESTCNFIDNKCVFLQGEEPKIKIYFKSNGNVDSLKTKVRARLDGSFVDFHIDNDDVCGQAGVTCPIETNKEEVYVAAVPIRNEYPAVDVQINWQLVDPSTDEQKVCIVFLGTVIKN
ncbi:MD-2-related lipid-recognition domain and Immunoglobulin E-set domain-containing protein [Strongyloides ratti]|uniref:MD-2-related lipid-recognition domain and Immunoglobulin E-set domain-containing protein n=1 Tax=Strongyloides ratti TaxID=34506 RepID=A0A090LSJ9_STRRB|nr:MD-2-related lipid-recognition domain and Immunoglobulin E-set domain-containing protein [Strongyloides ratti]CEF70583.1 MD-2-related lipid-recognition domain and Immunoglobulin E-set domain-containing protein [Strongyloides ratti]